MPPTSKRPSPPARMVGLLSVEKRRLLAANGTVTRRDFDEAWERCWDAMVIERAWAHRSRYRRNVRREMMAFRGEYRAAFMDSKTSFSFAAHRLQEVAAGMCHTIPMEQVGAAILAAAAYVEITDEAAAMRASTAASTFIDLPRHAA